MIVKMILVAISSHLSLPYLCAYMLSHSVGSDSLPPYDLQSATLLCLWDSPDKNTGVGCYLVLQGIFLTQGSNLCILHWQVGFFFYHQASWEAYISYAANTLIHISPDISQTFMQKGRYEETGKVVQVIVFYHKTVNFSKIFIHAPRTQVLWFIVENRFLIFLLDFMFQSFLGSE